MANGLFTLKQVNQALRQSAWSNQKPASVNYLVVAGGGGGGQSLFGDAAGGGGAGGLLQGNYLVTAGTSITVTVGAGGNAGTNNGGNSVFGSISASGGGGGANRSGNANSGGSGGGGAYSPSNSAEGLGIFGQGNSGAKMQTVVSYVPAGGGGGAGTSGVQYQKGGVGIASTITGTSTVYATGGDGGYNGTSLPAASGAANTGNGGYGGYSAYTSPANGGAGGSGIVVISYPDTYAAATSTSNATVTTSGSGSAYFNGTNQVLVYNSNNAFQFGSGNFTWEAWVNYLGGAGAFFDLGSVNSAGSFGVFVTGSTIYVRIDGTGNDLTYTYPAGFIGNWVHLAVVRNGTTLTLYYNGVSVASGTRLNNITQNTPYIGNLGGFTNYYFGGYLSNNRVVKGTAVYTGNFTPSTSPLTAISGTSLLLNTVSGAYLADGSTNGFAPTTGTVAPTWNSASPFATGLGYKNRVYTWTTSGSITF